MNIDFFGHACLRTRHRGGACLMDPWFSRDGAFFGTWFQFPENHHLLGAALSGITDICVSHNHADHFDPPVLRAALTAAPELRLHIARFATPWFRRRVERALGPLAERLAEHEPERAFRVGDAEVWFVPEESPGQIDSAIVVRNDLGDGLVNLNDARLSTSQLEAIRERLGDVGTLALQASGASEYPINYTWDRDEIRRRSREKRQLKFEACERIVDALDPRRVLFFAGPPAFLYPELATLGERRDDSVFPDQLDVLRHLDERRPDVAERCYFALPGDELVDASLWRALPPDSDRLTPYLEKDAYLADYRERREDLLVWKVGRRPDPARVLAHLEGLTTLSAWASDRIGGAVQFVVTHDRGEDTYGVDFARRRAWLGTADDPIYVLTIPAVELEAILRGDVPWDDAFLSLRMTFDERADRFVPHLKTLLKYLDREMFPALEAYEARLAATEAVPMFEVAHDSKTYRVQRLCPHAGVDLSRHGFVNDDGTITCMAHRFCFDLATGACVNAKGFALKVEPPRAT